MKSETKEFDAVEMKRRAQGELHEEESQLGREAFLKKMREDLLNDPLLGPIVRKAVRPEDMIHYRPGGTAASSVRETDKDKD
jgi:hypothetical protein